MKHIDNNMCRNLQNNNKLIEFFFLKNAYYRTYFYQVFYLLYSLKISIGNIFFNAIL